MYTIHKKLIEEERSLKKEASQIKKNYKNAKNL